MAGTSKRLPRAAYVHVPFCAHRCGYCNFTLVAGRDDLLDAYLQAIQLELEQLESPCEVDTLYFGGGTPTHLPPDKLQQLLDLALHWFPLAMGAEFTVEANPVDADDQRLSLLAARGVTRISLGAQSFDRSKLELLERDHDAESICRAVEIARRYVRQISLDLIFGVPGESLDIWRRDLAATLALVPDHVSTYGLTFERGTAFWSRQLKGELQAVAEQLERAMYETAIDTLTAASFQHYEVSNFARTGRRSRHNETYWTGGGYFAVGPGAARFVDGVRETNHRSTTTYIRRLLAGQSPVAEREQLEPADAARERLVFALRRLEGIDPVAFAEETGFEIDGLVGPALERYVTAGLITCEPRRLKLTHEGLLLSDSIWPDFLSNSQ